MTAQKIALLYFFYCLLFILTAEAKLSTFPSDGPIILDIESGTESIYDQTYISIYSDSVDTISNIEIIGDGFDFARMNMISDDRAIIVPPTSNGEIVIVRTHFPIQTPFELRNTDFPPYTISIAFLPEEYRSYQAHLKITTLDDEYIIELIGNSPTDLDRDGLEDQWEFDFFGSLDFDGNDDPDFDGIINSTEFSENTNPKVGSINTPQIFMDLDQNGYPDLHESQYGYNGASLPHNEDADADGIINIDEFYYGTNPLVSDAPKLDFNTETQTLELLTISGMYYKLEVSTDLINWHELESIHGDSNRRIFPVASENLFSESQFFRLQISHNDSDGGGMSDFEEIIFNSSPATTEDVDNDDIFDELEIAKIGSLIENKNSDGDGDTIKFHDEIRYNLDPFSDDRATNRRRYHYDFDRLTQVNNSITYSFDGAGNIIRIH